MVRPMRLRPTVLAGPLLAGLALSCANTPPPVAPEIPRPAPAPVATAAPEPVGPALLPAQVLALVDDESSSPYFARRADGAVLFYSAKGRWLTRGLAADGTPRAPAALDLAGLGADVSMVSLKPVGDGYLAVWVELVAQNRDVKLLSLDAEGKPRGEPVLVSQVTDELAWIDVLPNARGALVLWEVPHDDRSDLFVVPTSGGKLEGAPQLAAHEVIGWEAEATERGAAIATVATDAAAPAAPVKSRARKPRTPSEVSSPRGTKLGKVFLTEVDSHAKAGAPVPVSPEATAQLDVTLSEVGGRYVIAWTDERNLDACVYLAAVDVGGHVAAPPHRATTPFGEQALVSLVAQPFAPDAPRSKRGAPRPGRPAPHPPGGAAPPPGHGRPRCPGSEKSAPGSCSAPAALPTSSPTARASPR